MPEIVITESLQNTVRTHLKIDKIYFDAQGRHYFRVFELRISKENETKAIFGDGMFSHRQIIPGQFNIDKRTEEIPKGDPLTRIVHTMTRDEVISATAKKEGEAIAAQIVNASAEDKNIIMASLFDADTLAALNLLKSGKVKLVAVEEKVAEAEEEAEDRS